MKISIIGGSGDFGRIFAKIFREEGYEVIITGRNVEKGAKVAREIGVKFTNNNKKAAEAADIVIVSVYIDNTVEVIKEVAPYVRPGCLLMDFTSVKEEPCSAMVKFAGEDVEIIGVHPMFGPRITSLEGQTFILTPIRSERWLPFLQEFLKKHKAKFYVTTPEEHDRIMSVVQGLTHFAYISVASTLKELDIDVKYTKKFASPIYGLMLDLIARIVGQSPQLYAAIQIHNPRVIEVHEKFIEEAKKLKDIVARKDKESFIKVMVESSKHLGDIDSAMGRSDKAILALTGELKKLSRAVGEEVALKHIYSGVVHVGKVKQVDPDRVTLITFSGKEVNLKLSNVELLSREELEKWKLENLPRVIRDFSIMFDEKVNEEIILKVVKSFDKRIVDCSLLDIYRGKQIPKGKKSITIRVEGYELDFKKIEELFRGIGGILR
jgi:prephenate dehydrogenase